MELGRLGVWTFLDLMSAGEAAAFVQRVEALGYSTLWLPEAIGRDPFTLLGYLAARTERLQFATGIANIYARDPMTMRAIQQTMAELSGGRFVLGLGRWMNRYVSHWSAARAGGARAVSPRPS